MSHIIGQKAQRVDVHGAVISGKQRKAPGELGTTAAMVARTAVGSMLS
jgi:hypothetical protein